MQTDSNSPQPTEHSTEIREIVEQLNGIAGSAIDHQSSGKMPFALGKYELLGLLSAGGQAYVFLAMDPDLNRQVVIKVYYQGMDDVQRERLMNEGRALARINSPYVAKCLAVEEFDGQPGLIIEYVAGAPLHSQGEESFNEERAVEITRKIARGVSAIHQQGLLHRDLKPGNVILKSNDDPVIIDFGLVQPVHEMPAGDSSGTPAFMPPERARRDFESIDVRSDVFGVGAILYYLVTGQPPFPGSDAAECRRSSAIGKVKSPRTLNESLSWPVDSMCMKCLNESVDQRYSTMDNLVLVLENLPAQKSRLHPVRWWAGLGVLLAIATVVGLVNLGKNSADDPLPPSRVQAVFESVRRGDPDIGMLKRGFKLDIVGFETAWSALEDDQRQRLRTSRQFPFRSDGLVELELEHPVFMTVKPNRDCYITVFAFQSDAESEVLGDPVLIWNQDALCRRNQEQEIGINPNTLSMRTEYIYVLASTTPFSAGEFTTGESADPSVAETLRGIEALDSRGELQAERLIPFLVSETLD